jgi:WD40 repeat protein
MTLRTSVSRSLLIAGTLALGLSACDDGTSPEGTARIRVLLTDAPSDYIGEAYVDIGAVELLPAGDGDRITLSTNGTDGPVNLLDLQGLTTELLADVDIPSGTYTQLRLFVDSARVVLSGDYTFEDGSTEDDLRVPSGASSGLKLKLRSDEEGDPDAPEGVDISGGETVLVVDFDVNQSFRIQGNPDTPAGISGVSFQPTLRVVVQDVAGSISGTVSPGATGTSVGGLVVTATTVDPGDNEEFQSSTATATTDENGAYTIYFLAPGDYTVEVVVADGLGTDPANAEITVDQSGNVTGVDFEVITP